MERKIRKMSQFVSSSVCSFTPFTQQWLSKKRNRSKWTHRYEKRITERRSNRRKGDCLNRFPITLKQLQESRKVKDLLLVGFCNLFLTWIEFTRISRGTELSQRALSDRHGDEDKLERLKSQRRGIKRPWFGRAVISLSKFGRLFRAVYPLQNGRRSDGYRSYGVCGFRLVGRMDRN